jgi:STE24 endopeptidase
MHPFAAVFLAALAAATIAKLWLAGRHARHVAAHRGCVPAEFAATIPLDAHQKAADYTVAKTRLGVVWTLAETALLLALTFGGGLQALDGLAAQIAAPGIVRGLVLMALVAAVFFAVELPFGIYRTFVIEQRFGFNRMTPKLFVIDMAKGIALAGALGLPLAALVLWLMGRTGEYWWLYAWAAWVAFNLLLLAVYPTWIAPLFNKFSPLADAEMKARVERLLERCGFHAKSLMVMDGSKRSAHGNAYFTGFGRTKRIVFFDTLLERLTGPEVEAVLAHELGHFKLRHVVKRIAWAFAASAGFLWLLGVLERAPWFYHALGVTTPSTAMALVLFALVVPVFTFLAHPLTSHYSRRHEFEADRYAAEHAAAGELVTALVKLYKDNASTLTPDPLHSAFYDSHPPAALRIARLRAATGGANE